MLSILSGHKRYPHVTAMPCDGVNPGLLGMGKVISEDGRRNALKRIPEVEGTTGWAPTCRTARPSCSTRPSHSYHTYLMAGTRLVLGVEVRVGNEHTAKP